MASMRKPPQSVQRFGRSFGYFMNEQGNSSNKKSEESQGKFEVVSHDRGTATYCGEK